MGQEIATSRFEQHHFDRFDRRLSAETAQLGCWFAQRRLSSHAGMAGFELEAWLVDPRGDPTPLNERFLAAMHDPLLAPELSQFNVEFNVTPQPLYGNALRKMHDELAATWARGQQVAAGLGARLAMIGILPTLRDAMLHPGNMSTSERYRALNEQVLRLRSGKALRLDIVGEEHLHSEHLDVMLEAATTSFQLHWQVPLDKSVRYYNAMQLLSAPLVALGANSPLLFGKRLWHETRIPLFEQAVAVGGFADAAFGPLKRVSFGTGYARESLLECFHENHQHFPVLLPVELEEPCAALPHLRLHNGTIWRWNRPLIGFDADGTPHLRIEHRTLPAGPSLIDTLANAAFFYGVVHMLAEQATPPERQLDFVTCRDNFYQAARYGRRATLVWLDGRHGNVVSLLRDTLLPLAREGLNRLDCDPADIDDYLGVIQRRLMAGTNGAEWQLEALGQEGGDLHALLARYLAEQAGGEEQAAWR